MKLTVLSVLLASLLVIATSSGVSYAAASDVKVYAKEKQGMLLVLIKNGSDENIHTLTITLLDGVIIAADVDDWKIRQDSANQITVTTAKPVPPQGREIFFVKTDNLNSIISWSAKDRFGEVVAMDNARTIVKRTVDVASGPYKVINPVTVSTDKIFYQTGENMLITGALDPNSKLTITIYTPTGQKLKISDNTDPRGTFQVLHVLHNAESGTYLIEASQPTAIAQTTFKVL